eukprot:s3432_g2.t1
MNYQERLPLLEYCKQQGILVQAYGSLFFGKQEFMDRPELANVAGAHPGFSAAHVLLHRIKDNLKVLDLVLSEEELQSLSAMQGTLGAYWQPLSAVVDVGDTTRGSRAEL